MSFFQNKVIWITGASSGIGKALAIELASKGVQLILSSRKENELNKIKSENKLDDQQCLVLPLDLENTSSIHSLTQKIISHFGRIDVLINNGGISQRSFAKDTPLDIDRKIMEVNFFGTVAITKSVLPHMIKQNSGIIVVISSISGKFGFYLRSAYAASKHALHGFFESLRMEVEKNNVQITIVCPGKIHTDISVNAITASGQVNGKMDRSQAEGMSADECVRIILKAVENNEEEVFIGGKELRAIWIKRFFPKLFSKLIRKQKIE